ncbi:MAG: hypothetical protein GF353_01755 [Candidatus Lokiarchaeota archaeon]|nr:hypothetical protein [Candidatus Lokiarchaeota archaeon]
MNLDFAEFIKQLSNIQIVWSFIQFLNKPIKTIFGTKNVEKFENLSDLKVAFFDDLLNYRDKIIVQGRLSQYCPIYFPIAYSPQVPGMFKLEDGASMQRTYLNAAPTAMQLKHSQGGLLAFLFPQDAQFTPKITSYYHLDRTSTIPIKVAEIGIPVIIDQKQIKYLEQIVEIRALISLIDEDIQGAIDSSEEEFVKNYYHGFFKSDHYPNKGFMLDARTECGGEIVQTSEHFPFYTNICIELKFNSSLLENSYSEILNSALDGIPLPPGINSSRHNYQPDYYTPKGYKIVQIGRPPFLAHIAYEKATIQLSMTVDVTSEYSGLISNHFLPSCKIVLDKIRENDKSVEFKTLFSSDRFFSKELGISFFLNVRSIFNV